MIYADSRFFVAHYVEDAHSAEVDGRMRTLPQVWLTPFQRVELMHAIHQYVFRQSITQSDARQIVRNFERDCAQKIWISAEQPKTTDATCERIARQHVSTLGVRTLDSLHVAAALDLGATHFWTFDRRQARLAEAEGLLVA